MLFTNKPVLSKRLSHSFKTITVGLLSPEEMLDRSFGLSKGSVLFSFHLFEMFCATSKCGLLRSVRDDEKLSKIGRAKKLSKPMKS